jgi:lipoprotein LprG
MRSRTSLAALGTAVVLLASLTGCGGGSGSSESPAKALAEAKATMDQASSWHMVLSTDATPSGDAVLKADGVGTHDPAAWKGSVDVMDTGFRATVPLVAVDGKVYAKIPLGPPIYTTIDPAEYNAPDPAGFMDPDSGLSALLTKLEDARSTGTARAGSQVVTTYGGTLAGADVQKIIPSADAKGTYATTVNIDKRHEVTSVTVKGPFFEGSGDVTYTLDVDDYGQDVKITAP